MGSLPATDGTGDRHMIRAVVASASDRCLRGPDPELELRVETGLPSGLPGGCRTALFIYGSCFHRRHRVRRIELLAGDAAVPAHSGMPRADVHRTMHPFEGESGREPKDVESDDPKAHSYRSGFWATVPIEMPEGGALELKLRATLSDRSHVAVSLGEVPVVPRPEPDPQATTVAEANEARIGIALASYDPNLDLFRAQIDSIRAQSRGDWVCVISDDCSPPRVFERMREIVEADERFVLRRSARRRGFYGNFERALELLPRRVDYVALADQDDRWYAEKLATLADAIGDANLVYSDQRIVDSEGEVVAPSYWGERINNYEDLTSLLITNTVTGAASLFRRDLLELALPFPQPPGEQYHDHWLGLVALASGRIAYVDEPLYNYVQHGGAALGHAAAVTAPTGLGQRLSRLVRGSAGEAALGSRAAYFYGLRRLQLLAQVLLMRCGDRLDAGSRRALQRMLRSERSPSAMLWLAGRPSRAGFGHRETGGAEHILLQGIIWRQLQRILALGRSRPPRGQPLEAPHDASLPPLTGLRSPAATPSHPFVRKLAEFIEPIELSISERAPRRVNLLVPTIELKHLFGGYITKFNFARRLADQGLRTRIVAVDSTPHLPLDWRERVESYEGLSGLFDRVEVAFSRDQDSPLEVSPDDAFVATTWWTAHVAGAALSELDSERFIYLIQEYEPYTHPMGSWAALAMASYELPHYAIFSTELLREFFARRGYGVFAAGEESGRRDSRSFQNAITPVAPPSAAELEGRTARRLLFYARPEAHATRNMFELGLMGLSVATSRGAFEGDWSFAGIGTVEGWDRIGLGEGIDLELLTRRDQASYASLLTGCDVGLALMLTPHPSLVPLEMASAGMVTVTNSFENKTAAAMEAISGNLIAADPSLEGIAAGLERAASRAGDHDARVRGAEVRWSRDWDTSFDDDLMNQVVDWLASC
jgi:glycosyltransferase involved in cell wall biosynthesis